MSDSNVIAAICAQESARVSLVQKLNTFACCHPRPCFPALVVVLLALLLRGQEAAFSRAAPHSTNRAAP
jgi:hypothetical protein